MTDETTTAPPVEIGSIARLKVEPGDVLVIRTPDRLTYEQGANYEKWLKARIGENVPIIILDNATELQLLALGDRLALDTVPLTGPDGGVLGWIARSVAEDVLTGRKPLSFSIAGLGQGQTIQTPDPGAAGA